jgi:hypothetical protein
MVHTLYFLQDSRGIPRSVSLYVPEFVKFRIAQGNNEPEIDNRHSNLLKTRTSLTSKQNGSGDTICNH